MFKIVFYNNSKSHYEILESVILYFSDVEKDDIYLYIHPNISFQKYILNKYPNLHIKILQISINTIINFNLKEYNKIINCSSYDLKIKGMFEYIKKSNKDKEIFISHEITNRIKFKNVYFLTPLCNNQSYFYADKLPFSDTKIKTFVPIFLIQGNITSQRPRRNFKLLENILKNNYKFNYKIKIMGKKEGISLCAIEKIKKNGKKINDIILPDYLIPYKDKLIIKSNLNFIDYHKELQDCYCIIPLVLKKTQPQYYCNSLTSSINYARGYNIKCLIDTKLNKIYNLENAYTFEDENDISKSFSKLLDDFYAT